MAVPTGSAIPPRGRQLSVLLVDPSLFTGPYDAALSEGLALNGVSPSWAVRPLRTGEEADLPAGLSRPVFYVGLHESVRGRGTLLKLRKGASHLGGSLTLARLVARERFDLVHFQWTVMPGIDAWFIRHIARRVPVVLTLHDSKPFNGSPTSRLQMIGFESTLRAASRIVVHTAKAREALIGRGIEGARVRLIPHGPMRLKQTAGELVRPAAGQRPWTIVLFGKLQPYKGIDVLIEAVGCIPEQTRSSLQIVIAGEPLMPLEPLLARISELRLGSEIELRPHRHSEAEMATLFASTDTFVFPYRQIEASGVLSLVEALGKWTVASDLGSFSERIVPGRTGTLVRPNDPAALATALLQSVGRAPDAADRPPALGWDEIGKQTRALYEEVLAEYAAR